MQFSELTPGAAQQKNGAQDYERLYGVLGQCTLTLDVLLRSLAITTRIFTIFIPRCIVIIIGFNGPLPQILADSSCATCDSKR